MKEYLKPSLKVIRIENRNCILDASSNPEHTQSFAENPKKVTPPKTKSNFERNHPDLYNAAHHGAQHIAYELWKRFWGM